MRAGPPEPPMYNLALLSNSAVGSPVDMDGKHFIQTQAGAVGHALYGPYEALGPGHYAVEFCLRPAEKYALEQDAVCARVDVAVRSGNLGLVHQDIQLSRLQHGEIFVPLIFYNKTVQPFEFRVHVSGQIPLLIETRCRVITLTDASADYVSLLAATRFPDPNSPSTPEVFRTILSSFQNFYEHGAIIKVVQGSIIVNWGVSFHANRIDDVLLVGDMFLEHVYNFVANGEWCAIDIGMNVGLTSLFLAAKPFVREVHAFEPFKDTLARARANLSLNPNIAGKICVYDVGLGDKDEDKTVLIPADMPSGSFAVDGLPSGEPHQISVRDAATVLRPIIQAAKARGHDVIVKVDCEGSEFPIFATLDAHGLIEDIAAFMVEWHKIDWAKTQHEMIASLVGGGFVVFDLAPKGGNGFFYAVRCRR